jgi:hypothetical protein
MRSWQQANRPSLQREDRKIGHEIAPYIYHRVLKKLFGIGVAANT